ncbi:hypothetical protein [Streptomyces griseoloalbus]|uniref:Uncharacterized protein n=1 Tax=Streptomyces griseoloalbus TaxID=67303 RepID=A0A7W8BNL9_9ACTN|nr:hypothetical protein [Streptomyces albaduncus]MBB5126600.1 hypothetical protein [Streptomyces albaduncus]GGV68251.1 hypothetical protein GCM10010294_23800 [Streptomyces griseoloalbus]GGW42259.1 hypothetical protein GCM10010340_20180 [Streptomyces albaduncus]
MTNREPHLHVPADPEGEWASLRGDCARMVPHWTVPDRVAARPVSPSLIHGVNVPPSSARLLDAMSEYGD